MTTRYRLHPSAPEFQVMDGPFKGRAYRHGAAYKKDDIPPEHAGRFEPIPKPPAPAQPSAPSVPASVPSVQPSVPTDQETQETQETPEPPAEEPPRRPRRKK